MRRFFVSLIIAILAMLVAESITSDDALAQRRPPLRHIALHPGWELVILEYPPPPEYEKWWQEIAACEHLPLPPDHDRVQFFAVNGREFAILDDPFSSPWEVPDAAIGYSDIFNDQIYLAFPYLADERIVKHEQLHWLMWQHGEQPGHPESRYGKENVGMCGVVPYRVVGKDDK